MVLAGMVGGAALAWTLSDGRWRAAPDASLPDLVAEVPADARSGSEGAVQDLLDSLPTLDGQGATEVEDRIWRLWLDSGSPTVNLLTERGVRALDAGDLELARDLLDRVVRLAPDYAEGWNRRATVFFRADDYADAFQDLERVLRLEPRHFGAWTGLGLMFESLGETAKALEAYERALAIHPNLGLAQQGRDRLAAAAQGRDL
jgi:tetratricopeptide (TPR) repeat protein